MAREGFVAAGTLIPGTKYWDRVPREQHEYWMHDCCEPDCPRAGALHPPNDFTHWRCHDHWMFYQRANAAPHLEQARLF